MGKRNRYRDHVDPEHQRWGRTYPRFPGVAECVRLINFGKARGTWADIIVDELSGNAKECLSELIAAYRDNPTGGVRLFIMMALDSDSPDKEAIRFLKDVIREGNRQLIPYAERALAKLEPLDCRRDTFSQRPTS
jgi:hypothetical protein